MEKKNFMPLLFSAAIFMACNNASNSSNDTASADSDTGNSMSNRSVTMDTGSNRMNTTANTTDTLSKMDRDFVMKAASGGMMEVEAANLAMQNASSERVKGFASMMIRDHSQANNELKTLASRRNVTLPTSPMP
ncbi:MAG: DUF4142 domain-containing protein, partial [Flavisolibacter sp.]|nr:DUF4142 domain-containing protein [Flavisolibacter sp.]